MEGAGLPAAGSPPPIGVSVGSTRSGVSLGLTAKGVSVAESREEFHKRDENKARHRAASSMAILADDDIDGMDTELAMSENQLFGFVVRATGGLT